MSTEKQILANRQNALKSTGPRTPEGKVVSSRNALRHGLRTRALLSGEDQAAYEESAEKYRNYFQPVGPVETSLVEEMIHCDWWLRERAVRAETQILVRAAEMERDAEQWRRSAPNLTPLTLLEPPGAGTAPADAVAHRYAGTQADAGDGPPATRDGQKAASPSLEANDSGDPVIWPAFYNSAGALQLLQRHIATYNRHYYQALEELTDRQNLRRARQAAAAEVMDVTATAPDSPKEVI